MSRHLNGVRVKQTLAVDDDVYEYENFILIRQIHNEFFIEYNQTHMTCKHKWQAKLK